MNCFLRYCKIPQLVWMRYLLQIGPIALNRVFSFSTVRQFGLAGKCIRRDCLEEENIVHALIAQIWSDNLVTSNCRGTSVATLLTMWYWCDCRPSILLRVLSLWSFLGSRHLLLWRILSHTGIVLYRLCNVGIQTSGISIVLKTDELQLRTLTFIHLLPEK